MIHVTIYETKDHQYIGFNCIGHAGYSEIGEDIVCAAVSALTITCVNSIEQLVGDSFRLVTNEEEGLMDVLLEEGYHCESLLLLASLVLGLREISESYGREFISLECKEV